MARRTSKGTCAFCHGEVSKSQMVRHLESCQQRATIQAEAESNSQGQHIRVFHLMVEGYRLPIYWMHLQVPAQTTLAALDQFLRTIWLECCGHLSEFEIENARYSVDPVMYSGGWYEGYQSMHVPLDTVLRVGQSCSYTYDMGSSTELMVKVISEREAEATGEAIQVLARNLPHFPCERCGKPATHLCAQCSSQGQGDLCDACAKEHPCGEDALSPLPNSPRFDVCGYTGQTPAYTF